MKYRSLLPALLRWLPVLSWMFLIFWLSHQPGDESRRMSEWVVQLVRWLGMDETSIAAGRLNFLIRKAAHFTEYCILSLLLSQVLARSLAQPRLALTATLLTALYACTDEWHQTFVPGRVGTWTDALIDTAGALLGAGIWHTGQRFFRHNSKKIS
ncbi:MAG: VanZ family protein [Bacteroidia bacterium]|nr:VanZ family protein [Bacteroidia bacterium]